MQKKHTLGIEPLERRLLLSGEGVLGFQQWADSFSFATEKPLLYAEIGAGIPGVVGLKYGLTLDVADLLGRTKDSEEGFVTVWVDRYTTFLGGSIGFGRLLGDALGCVEVCDASVGLRLEPFDKSIGIDHDPLLETNGFSWLDTRLFFGITWSLGNPVEVSDLNTNLVEFQAVTIKEALYRFEIDRSFLLTALDAAALSAVGPFGNALASAFLGTSQVSQIKNAVESLLDGNLVRDFTSGGGVSGGVNNATPPGGRVAGAIHDSRDDHSNDFGTAATQILLDVNGYGESIGVTNSPADPDWFQFRPSRPGPIKIEVRPLDGNLLPHTRYHWDNGTLIAQDSGGGVRKTAKVQYANADPTRSYFVQVTGAGGSTGGYRVVLSQPSQLDPDPSDQPPPNPAPPVDGYPNSMVSAHPVALDSDGNATVSGAIEMVGDDDWFTFTARQTGNLIIEIDTPNSSLDTHLRLHNDNVLLAQDHSYLQRPVTAGETFWLHVRAGSESGADDIGPGEDPTGRYRVTISQPGSVAGSSGSDSLPAPLPELGGAIGVEITLDPSGNGNSSGSIDESSEEDWFVIKGAQAGNMLVTVAGVNDDLKEFVTAFREDFAGIDTDSGEFDSDATVGFTVADAETTLVRVTSYEGRYTGGYTIAVSQPESLPDDDTADFGETPYNMDPDVSDEGNGFIRRRIEEPTDDDWFVIPLDGTGYATIDVVARNSAVVPFLELNRDGTGGGFFETDDGRDGRARVTFLPSPATAEGQVWAKVSSVDDTQGSYTLNVWRGPNKNDDHPDSGGVYAAPHALPEHGQVIISGSSEHPGDNDTFRIEPDQPGAVSILVISQSEGFTPFVTDVWQTPDLQGDSNTDAGSGRGGRTYHTIPNVMAAPHNWVNISIRHANDEGTAAYGDYVLYVWQPESVGDKDPDTIGIEASPIMLDGAGNGILPGSPNGAEESPALDHAGDKDVFQVRAASRRPITFTVSGTPDTFLRLYDAAGQSIATDHDSGPGGESQVTLDAGRGELFYLEVSGYNGAETGLYTVQVSQAADDHPDAPIFEPQKSQVRDATVIALDAGTGFGEAGGEIELNLVGDRDVFQVYAAERGQFSIDLFTTDDMLDGFLRVYDSRGNLVAIDDDGGDSRNSQATFTTFMDETYQIEVSGYGDNSVGNYTVSVQSEPYPTQTFVGTYDDFEDASLDDLKWREATSGTGASLIETGGEVVLTANGNGANDPNNSTELLSRAVIGDNVAFDFTPTLATEENSALAEVTDGTSYVRLEMQPAGVGALDLTVVSSGYVEVSNAGTQSLTTGTSYNGEFRQSGDELLVLLDGVEIARFEGPIKTGSMLRGFVEADRLPLYDDFNDNSINGGLWNTSGDVVESGGRLHLWLRHNGNLQNSRADTQNKPGGHDIQGFKLNADRTAGTVNGGQAEAWVGITNGPDYVRIRWLSDVNELIVETGGAYGEGHPAHRWDPDEPGPAETPDGPFEIRERDGNIEFLHNGQVQYSLQNQSIEPGSWFEVRAYGQDGEGGPLNREYELMIDDLQIFTGATRFAELKLDNVSGTLALPPDAELVSYDDFDDNDVDFDKWHVAGTVNESAGKLKLPHFLSFQAVNGYASTAGIPGGTNLRGFKLNFDRTTEPKNLGTWDITTRLELTNGNDILRIDGLHETTYRMEARGAYGTYTQDVTVPTGQIPDGPFEIRERDGDIEFLHNGQVKLTVPNQTVRAGSFFTFQTHGNPFDQSMSGEPENFDAFIDNLEFYVDPQPNEITVSPSLAQASDSGASDADHITNLVSLDFEWVEPLPGTQYQWREGELQADGSIGYGAWSDPQPETTAHIDLASASIHVFSVRTIDANGIVGQESGRGISVDTDGAALTDDSPTLSWPPLAVNGMTFTFDEAIDPSSFTLSDVVSFTGPGGDLSAALSGVSGNGNMLAVQFADQTAEGTYELVLSADIFDIAGNPLDQDGDGMSGEPFDDEVTGSVTLGLLGNMDWDSDFDLDDVAPFVLGLTRSADYEMLYGVPPYLHGDMDQDGDLDLDDIGGFVQALSAGPGAGGSQAERETDHVGDDQVTATPVSAGVVTTTQKTSTSRQPSVPSAERPLRRIPSGWARITVMGSRAVSPPTPVHTRPAEVFSPAFVETSRPVLEPIHLRNSERDELPDLLARARSASGDEDYGLTEDENGLLWSDKHDWLADRTWPQVVQQALPHSRA